jgi:hypothetical protein
MKSLFLAAAMCLAASVAHAGSPFDSMLAQAPATRSPACTCVNCTCVDCQCSGTESAELLRLRAYRDSMESWIAKHDYRNPALYARPVSTSRVVATTSPIVTYADDGYETVCENGVCRRVARQSYTGGYYTSGIPQSYGRPAYKPRVFNFKRIGSGFGSCANGQCQ